MPQITISTSAPEKAVQVVKEVLATETSRIEHSLSIARKRLAELEKKYNVSSEKFAGEWTAEDLEGKDLEYVEWAGEYKLFSRLSDRYDTLKSIQNITA